MEIMPPSVAIYLGPFESQNSWNRSTLSFCQFSLKWHVLQLMHGDRWSANSYRIIYVLEWRMIYAPTRESWWHLWPVLHNNEGNKHHNNARVTASYNRLLRTQDSGRIYSTWIYTVLLFIRYTQVCQYRINTILPDTKLICMLGDFY